ncbi:endonuclease domain-containing protein [Cupriavidus campinensis]
MPKPSFVRALRAGMTEAEQRLWYHLRAHRFLGLKFKRQMPLGPFIADFVCIEFKLVIEADGGQHGSEADEKRDGWFRREGYTVLRFWNNEILQQTESVLEAIRQAVLARGYVDTPALSPGPSPASGRGENTERVSRADGCLPSPSGRGAGGEGERTPKPQSVNRPLPT